MVGCEFSVDAFMLRSRRGLRPGSGGGLLACREL